MQRHMTFKAGGLRHATSSASPDAAHDFGLRRTASAAFSLLPASAVSEAPADGAEGIAVPAASGEGMAATSAVERRWTRTSNGLGQVQGETWIVRDHCDKGCLQVRMHAQACRPYKHAASLPPISKSCPTHSKYASSCQPPCATSPLRQHTLAPKSLIDSSAWF